LTGVRLRLFQKGYAGLRLVKLARICVDCIDMLLD